MRPAGGTCGKTARKKELRISEFCGRESKNGQADNKGPVGGPAGAGLLVRAVIDGKGTIMMKTPGILKGGRCRGCPWRTPMGGCVDPVLKSGRCGDWVWYPRGSKQCRRRWVKPKDPRTPGQLGSRAAFGAASKAWSHSQELTEQQREDWRREARKAQSRARLGQSGPVTGQQNYVGRKTEKAGEGRQKEPTSQVPQSQRVARSTWAQHRRSTVVPPWQRPRGTGCGRKAKARRAASQVPPSQRVARSTWEGSGRAPEGPRCGPGGRSGVSWTVSQRGEGLYCGSARAGGRWLRQGGTGRSGGGLPSGHGSGGQERLARE